MKNFLVPIDLNENEEIVIEKALEFGIAFQAKIWLLHVSAPEPEFVGFGVGPQYIRDSRAKELRKEHKLLYEYANRFKANGLESDGLLINGGTIEMILEEAEKLNIDLIISGHHKHNFFYKAFFGSVASGVIKKSNIPVVLVPL